MNVSHVRSRLRWLRGVSRQAHLHATGPKRGRALLSYLVAPYFLAEDSLPTDHTHHWESREIGRILASLGYHVDVISYHNRWFRPKAPYDVIIDVRRNLERLAECLTPGGKAIMHSDTARTLSLVTAEHRRLLALQQRRGVTLEPRRYELPNRGIEHAHAGTVLGNDVTLDTYRSAGKPLYPIPVASTVSWPFPADKDFDRVRRRFLWLGSDGMVHKGLDRVLEVFAANPGLHLSVCGPVEAETDFVDAYRTELFDTPNITLHGFVDVGSPAFKRIAGDVVALVYPSSSEGCAGAVVTSLHAGLIPVVSRQSGVDVAPDSGLLLRDCSLEEITAAVRDIAEQPAHHLRDRAQAAWELARATYTRERFTARYQAALQDIID